MFLSTTRRVNPCPSPSSTSRSSARIRTGCAASSASCSSGATSRTPVAAAVSEPDNYGFIDLLIARDGSGIRGGVGGGPGYDSRALFYVGVADVERALERAEQLGGVRTMGPQTSPSGLVVGQFTDPAGNLIGLASAG